MLLSWKVKYRQAKFRNVRFFVDRTDNGGGRRLERHEFPKRDEPYIEDMGRSARTFSIEAYVLGDDYFIGRDALVAAAEKPGPGLLLHPYLGLMNVLCRSYRVSESRSNGRMCTISLSFEEAGSLAYPGIVIDTRARLNLSKISALRAAFDAFLSVYSTVRAQYAKVQNAIASVEAGFAAIESAKRLAASNPDFARQVLNLAGRAQELVQNPTALIANTQTLLAFGTFPDTGSLRASFANGVEQFAEMRTLFDVQPAATGAEDDPADVYAAALRWSAVITAGGLIAEVNFPTYEAAIEAQTVVLDEVDTIIESDIATDDLRVELRKLRAAIVGDTRVRSAALPRITETTLLNTVPAIVLSNELYGHVDREEDLVERNAVDHPGFMTAGKPIQVLIDAE
jgi:prophage DNA circulation protein